MPLGPKALEAALKVFGETSPHSSVSFVLERAIQAYLDAADLVPRSMLDAEIEGLMRAQRYQIEAQNERDEALHEAETRGKQLAALREVLADWENTPGNRRSAKWWHEWEDKRRAALTDTPAAPQAGEPEDGG